MKLPSFSLGREWKELQKFESLEPSVRSIVFYAENAGSIVHLQPLIDELTENLEREVCYLTSNPSDPILTRKNNKVHAFYIGSGTARTKMFLSLSADVLVMDMPDLETFHIKRSKTHPVHYIYVFHSMFSVHSYLRKGAVDNFDTIFCVGPHHVKEIRAAEDVYGLKTKNLIEYGYVRLDTLLEETSTLRQKISVNDNKKHIIIAPSFGVDSLLETKSLQIIKILLDAQCRVTVRPHPITTRKSPHIIKKIKDNFQDNPDFILETDISSYDSFYASDCMISDWSGVSMEYAFALEQPVLFVDVPKKINNPNFEDIHCEPIEINIRKQIGDVISPDQLDNISEKINSLLENLDKFKKQIKEIRSKTVYNIGRSRIVGAKHIVKIADECKAINKF
jgi:YidC/Oxa1 family membrane protein insertase|tara:strand:- start:1744 stop:2922 length:1179 start_codon:yes stop_codon:yes gene_type:complete